MTQRTLLIGYGMRDEHGKLLDELPDDLRTAIRVLAPDWRVVYVPKAHDPELHARLRTRDRAALLAEAERFPAAFLDALPAAEVLVTLLAPVDLCERAPHLRWVANAGSGTEHFRSHGLAGAGVALTSARGVAARSIAEFALSQMLVMVRRWPQRLADQRAHVWRWQPGAELDTMTLGIVGLGAVGQDLAPMAKALGMRVIATRRNLDQPVPPAVDAVLPAERLRELLGQSDVTVICAAYTPETANLFDKAAFSAMRPGSYLINVARGGIVDEAELLAVLREGRLAGAAFDVFSREPLPPDNPLWDAPNLLVTAHNAVGLVDYSRATMQRFLVDFESYLAGEPLPGAVDLGHGF